MRPIYSFVFILLATLTGCEAYDPEAALHPPVITAAFDGKTVMATRRHLKAVCENGRGFFDVISPTEVICRSEHFWPEGRGKVPIAFSLEQDPAGTYVQAVMFLPMLDGTWLPFFGEGVTKVIRNFLRSAGADNIFEIAEI